MFFLVCNFTLLPTSCSQLSLSLPPSSSTYNEYLLSILDGFFLSSVISVPVLSSLLPSVHVFLSLRLRFLVVIFFLRCVSGISLFPFIPFTTSSYFSPLLSTCLTKPLRLAPFPSHSLSSHTPFSCFPLTSSHTVASYLL